MIEHIYIKNVALIKEMSLSFCMGLNILSGETGAGKSILINSINFLLGARAGNNFIRKGEDSATVEGLFNINKKIVILQLSELGIQVDDDCKLLIKRNLSSNGKSNCFINGKNTAVSVLKAVCSLLIDIHGQHEHQSLLNPSEHISLLDKFCEEEMKGYKLKLTSSIKNYKNTINLIKYTIGSNNNIQDTVETLKSQISEIETADLSLDEEEKLLKRHQVISGYEKIAKNTHEALEYLTSQDSNDISTIDRIHKVLYLVTEISKVDNTQKNTAENLENICISLNEVCRDLYNYKDTLEYDPIELEYIQDRLNLIYGLKHKYGKTIHDIKKYQQTIINKLDSLLNSELRLEELNEEKKKYVSQIVLYCKKISEIRIKNAALIKDSIEPLLHDLGMKNARFDISIERKEKFSTNGYDKVEFLISPNVGETLKPLAKIASGGEMSRIMLALKTIMVHSDTIETFIFDEIDTGISGRTAQQIAEKLALISKTHQIICITHLAQIAAMSDKHFLIEKLNDTNTTTTSINTLNYDSSIKELARLIGGAEITEATVNAAAELKRQAKQIKDVMHTTLN